MENLKILKSLLKNFKNTKSRVGTPKKPKIVMKEVIEGRLINHT